MALTAEQLQALKTDILANTAPEVVQALADGANGVIADWYNQPASPAFYVFKNFVSEMDIKDNGIDWAEHLTLTEVELIVFGKLTADGGFNPEVETVREGLAAIFNGPQQVNTRTNILALSVRQANYAEKLFSTPGTGPAAGNGSAATQAALAVFAGDLTFRDVVDALNS